MSFYDMGYLYGWGDTHRTICSKSICTITLCSSSSAHIYCKRNKCSTHTDDAFRINEKRWRHFSSGALLWFSSGLPLPHASALSNYFIWMWVVLKPDGKGLRANTLQCLHRPQCRQSYHNTCFRREQICSMGPRVSTGIAPTAPSWMSTVWSPPPGPPHITHPPMICHSLRERALGGKTKRKRGTFCRLVCFKGMCELQLVGSTATS